MAALNDDQGSKPAVGVTRSIRILEHAQDVVTVTVGIVLIALAGVLLVSGRPAPRSWRC